LISVRGESMISTLHGPEGLVEKPPGGDKKIQARTT
jgi:hypothetical protein